MGNVPSASIFLKRFLEMVLILFLTIWEQSPVKPSESTDFYFKNVYYGINFFGSFSSILIIHFIWGVLVVSDFWEIVQFYLSSWIYVNTFVLIVSCFPSYFCHICNDIPCLISDIIVSCFFTLLVYSFIKFLNFFQKLPFGVLDFLYLFSHFNFIYFCYYF